MKTVSFIIIGLFPILLCLVLGRYGSAAPDTAKDSLLWISIWSVTALCLLPREKISLQLSRVCLIIVLLILGYGWLMVVNARANYVPDQLTFVGYEDRIWDAGPGSVTRDATLQKMFEISGLFLAFFAAVRSRESDVWKSLLALIPIAGVAITLIGLYHQVLDAEAVWFEEGEKQPGTFFAPFIYNGNAAQFLNFAGALSFSFWIACFWREGKSKKIVWGLATAICFLGVIATASKGGFILLFVNLGLLIVANRKRLMAMWPEVRSQVTGRGLEGKLILLCLSLILFSFAAVGIPRLSSRMNDLIEDYQDDGKAGTVEGRLGMMRVMLKMSSWEEGGLVGFGPGSYTDLVPYFLADEEYYIPGRWIHGHCDPLQLLVEWGYIGAALWIAFGLVALGHGFKTLKYPHDPTSRPLVRGMMIALFVMAVHSCADFPFGVLSLKFAAIFVCGLLCGGKPSRQLGRESN